MALSDFDRYPLLFGPSPVHPLDRLTGHLGGARARAGQEDRLTRRRAPAVPSSASWQRVR